MKIKKNKKIKDRNNNKIKRQISIITVFLWIFLVATMITVVIQNIKNTNALESDNVEIYDENNDLDNNVSLYASNTTHSVLVEFRLFILDSSKPAGYDVRYGISESIKCVDDNSRHYPSSTTHTILVSDIENVSKKISSMYR